MSRGDRYSLKLAGCSWLLTLALSGLPVSLGLALQLNPPESNPFTTDVIGIEEMHLTPDHWVAKLDNPEQLLIEPQAVADLNSKTFSSNRHMIDLDAFPSELTNSEVKRRIVAISKPHKVPLYYENGAEVLAKDYAAYSRKLNLEAVQDLVQVQFALITTRSDMRTYPTSDYVVRSSESKDLDRFQENGLFPGDVVAVLHHSRDGKWVFVQSYNYAAWVEREGVAIGDRAQVLGFKNAPHFLVITGDKVLTSFNPEVPAISELQLDMGVRLPLTDPGDRPDSLHGQNPYASHSVLLPVRNDQGKLEIKTALIARSQDVTRGFLPYTGENIARQAFKFLGERYGWGHSYNARDCTGFVAEVYKTFGIYMPRNSGQQGASSLGENRRFSDSSTVKEKLEALSSMSTGDLIYVPGHVLMFIGNDGGHPYVIHDVSGFGYLDENGEYYRGTLNGVSVTPFIPLRASQKSTYVDEIYNIKRIR